MFLEKSKTPNKRGYYLRIRDWIKVDGKRIKVTLKNIGFVDDKEVIDKWKEFVALDKELNEKLNEIKEELSKNNDDGNRKSINLGCCFIEQVLAIYSIRELLASYQREHDFDYQLYQDIIFLVEASILNPSSIENAVIEQNNYYKFYNIKLWDAYRSLDHIYNNMDKILDHFAKVSLKLFADSESVFYIDGSNTFTYSVGDEEDGIRKKGVSKENRNLPLVGMQLIMTHNGFPITFVVHSGNRHDSSQFIPAAKKILEAVSYRRIIMIGDSGYNSGTNNFFMAGKNITNLYNKGYLFSQSVNKISDSDRKWISDRKDWYDIDGEPIDPNDKDFSKIPFRYKERKISRIDEIWNSDQTRKLQVEVNLKQVVFYNEAYKDVRTKAIDKKVKRAFEISENPEKEIGKDLKKSTNSYSSFKSSDAEATVNLQKVQKDLKMAGYLLLETSEREISPMALLHLYNDKFWVEWLFRILKSDLNLRPFYLRLVEHIKAFMLIRFLALVVIRVLQHVLGYKYSAKKIINSLRNFNCIPYKNRFVIHGRDEIIMELEDFFGYHFKGEMTRKELDTIFSYKNLANFWDQQFCEIFSNPPGLKLTEDEKEEIIRNSRGHFRK